MRPGAVAPEPTSTAPSVDVSDTSSIDFLSDAGLTNDSPGENANPSEDSPAGSEYKPTLSFHMHLHTG
jgi:hypothetical protein